MATLNPYSQNKENFSMSYSYQQSKSNATNVEKPMAFASHKTHLQQPFSYRAPLATRTNAASHVQQQQPSLHQPSQQPKIHQPKASSNHVMSNHINANANVSTATFGTNNYSLGLRNPASSLIPNHSMAQNNGKSAIVPTGPGATKPKSTLLAESSITMGVPEYADDIFNYLKILETKYASSTSYMEKQPDLKPMMRSVLIDWLVDVHLKFKLMPETLYLTINFIDRFLSVKDISRNKLQLVGVTAMLLASKVEEIWCPDIDDFVYISATAYTKDEILKMEKTMLNALNFNLTVATMYPFVRRFIQISNSNQMVEQMSQYFCELSMREYRMLCFRPSVVAAAAVYVSNVFMGLDDPWPRSLQIGSGYDIEKLRPCAKCLVKLAERDFDTNNKNVSLRKKYSSQKRFEVAPMISERLNLPHIKDI